MRSSATTELAVELAEARQRLAFYETFDLLIRDNVLRTGELLRQVAAEQGQSEQQRLAIQTQLDQRLAEQRSTLTEIATGLAGLQANLVAIGERVAASLARLGEAPSGVPVAAEPPAGDQREVSGPSERIDEAIADRTEATTAPETLVQSGRWYSPGMSDSGTIQAANAAPAEIDSGRLPDQSLVTATNGTAGKSTAPDRRTIDVIVHGVPKAATALSLQRYLQELQGVETVDVREYVSGVLRFQMVATEFGPEDLLHWPGAGGLEAVTKGDHVLELRLVPADGF